MNADRARQILAAQFPELALATLSGPSSGTSNDCFVVDGTWIFRFPHDAEAEDELRRELVVLPELASRLDPAIPRYVFHGRPAAGYQHPFVGYRKISGTTLTRARLEALPAAEQEEAARRLGSFFCQLHDYPLDRVRAAEAASGVAMRKSPIEWFENGGADFRRLMEEKLAEHRDHPDHPRFAALAAALVSDAAAFQAEETLLHGDLSQSHVLYCDERRTVTGILDFGNLAVGDPFADFMQLADHYGRPFCDRVLAHYARPTAALIARKLDTAKLAMDNLRDFKRLMGWRVSSPAESAP